MPAVDKNKGPGRNEDEDEESGSKRDGAGRSEGGGDENGTDVGGDSEGQAETGKPALPGAGLPAFATTSDSSKLSAAVASGRGREKERASADEGGKGLTRDAVPEFVTPEEPRPRQSSMGQRPGMQGLQGRCAVPEVVPIGEPAQAATMRSVAGAGTDEEPSRIVIGEDSEPRDGGRGSGLDADLPRPGAEHVIRVAGSERGDALSSVAGASIGSGGESVMTPVATAVLAPPSEEGADNDWEDRPIVHATPTTALLRRTRQFQLIIAALVAGLLGLALAFGLSARRIGAGDSSSGAVAEEQGGHSALSTAGTPTASLVPTSAPMPPDAAELASVVSPAPSSSSPATTAPSLSALLRQPSNEPTSPPTAAPSAEPTSRPATATFSAEPMMRPTSSPIPELPPTRRPTTADPPPSSSPSLNPSSIPRATQSPTPSLVPKIVSPIPSPAAQPTPRPSPGPTPELAQASKVEDEIRNVICGLLPGTCSDLSTEGTPQFQALTWVTSDPDWPSYSPAKRVQRYVLSVVGYSTELKDGAQLGDGMDECALASTKCNEDGVIVELDLGNRMKGGRIPRDLALLDASSLEMLDLWSNKLRGSIPSELGRLASLRRLHLDDNELTGRVPRSLGGLINLEELSLETNNLSGTMPEEVCELRSGSLEMLSVDCEGVDCSRKCCNSCCKEEGKFGDKMAVRCRQWQ